MVIHLTMDPLPQPSININWNEITYDVSNLSRCLANDAANFTVHNLNIPGIRSVHSIDVNKLLEVIWKFADNASNLQEML